MTSIDTPNPDLQMAEEFVRETNSHIFLTGKAGTGKTTFLHNLKKQTHKRLVVTAPTGIAAINAGGVTLHSFFQLPFGPFIPGSQRQSNTYRFSREKKNIINSLDLLVIDEISMVRADLLDGVDDVLRRHRRDNRPFGGVQLLMIGDLLQLSPVAKESEWRILQSYYETPYFFSSRALGRSELVAIELKYIYRQSDNRFIDLLNRVRDEKLDPATLQQLNSRYIPDFAPGDDQGYITLCTHNSGAEALNASRLRSLAGKRYRFDAELEGDFPQQAYPTAAALDLKVGAQVMFIRNDSAPEKRYFNGKIGKITDISGATVKVKCPADNTTIEVEKAAWENIEYSVNPKTAEISQKTIGTFKQYPLKLAWAITIHKSQGLTFDKVIIDAQAAFAYGQVYVALSRCRTFDGMVLNSKLTSSAVKSDDTVYRFLEENQRDAPSRERLEAAKARYQQELILECFGFRHLDALLDRLVRLLSRHAGRVQVSGAGDIAEIRNKTRTEIRAVGEKFEHQLQGLFADARLPADDVAVQERLRKAATYFEGKLDTLLTPLIADIRMDTDNKDIRKQFKNTIEGLGRETAVKRAAVKSCHGGFSPSRYLRAVSAAAMDTGPAREAPAAAYAEADIEHPELFQALKDWRQRKAADAGVAHFQVLHQKTLIQIAVHLPDCLTALMKVKGIGKGLAERYGEELVALVTAYRRKHGIIDVVLPEATAAAAAPSRKPPPRPKADTKKTTLELFGKGLTIDQIAAERGLVVPTIEGHLAYFVEQGQLEIGALVPDRKREAIELKAAGREGGSLKALKTALGADYSYGEIKLVLAHLKHIRHSEAKNGK